MAGPRRREAGGRSADPVGAFMERCAVLGFFRDQPLGRAVQVDPIKPTLKPPVTKRLKTKMRDTAFKFCCQIQPAPLQLGISIYGFVCDRHFFRSFHMAGSCAVPRPLRAHTAHV
jgi:hypothetical protein